MLGYIGEYIKLNVIFDWLFFGQVRTEKLVLLDPLASEVPRETKGLGAQGVLQVWLVLMVQMGWMEPTVSGEHQVMLTRINPLPADQDYFCF